MVDVEALAGTTLGQYELRRLIGSGGMGAVYRGMQVNLQRDVAVKVLSNKLIANADYVERFNREALIAASLEHAHIVPIYDYGIQGEINYVVMRLLTGGSLDQRLGYVDQADRPLPSVQETLDVMRQIANALDYAHSQGVVHRDIKASNVMFDKHGDAFLVDFGIARMLESTSQLTGTGMTLGTPSYMSPEQWRGEEAVPQSDQYSVGVLAFALLTGQLPFSAPNPHSLLYMHLNDPPPSPQSIRPELGVQLDAVFEQVMAKDPTDRYETVSDFIDALEAAAPTADLKAELHQNTGFFITTLPEENRAEPTPASEELNQPTAQGEMSAADAQPEAETEVIDSSEPSNQAVTARRQQQQGWLPAVAVVVLLLLVGGGAGMSYMQAQQTPPGGLFVAMGLISSPTPTATTTPNATATNTRQPTETPTMTPATPMAVSVRDNLVLRTGPGNEYPVRTTLAVNEAIDIIGISEDDEWYRVQTRGDAQGWVRISSSITVGGDLQSVPVALAPTFTPTQTSTVTETPPVIATLAVGTATPDPRPQTRNCPGALPTRLVVGEQGYVLDDDPRPVNVRSRPALIATRIGQIPVRSTFEVIDGPECRVGIAWFQVRYNGLEGWIAEGEGPTYFVEPAQPGRASPEPAPTDSVGVSNMQPQVQAYVERFPACESILLNEDFEGDSGTTWYEEDVPEFRISVRDGRYAIEMRDITMPGGAEPVSWGSLQEVRFGDGRVDAVIGADKFSLRDSSRTGIWLRYQNEENFLAFMINSRSNYRVSRFEGEYDDSQEWEPSSAINTGQNAVNWISVDVSNNIYDYYINGELVTTIRDDRWADGRIAFFGSTLDQPARFSLEHLRICDN